MSFLDDIEVSLESFFDMMEKCENNSLKYLTTTDSEEAESSDDTVSTSRAVDPDNPSVPVDLSAAADKIAIIEKDPSESACGISDSEASSLGTPDSPHYAFSWMRPRPGIWGFIDEVDLGLYRARWRGYLLPFELMCLGFAISCCFMVLFTTNKTSHLEKLFNLLKPLYRTKTRSAHHNGSLCAQYWPMCPANAYIPRYVFVSGAIGTFSACVQIMDTAWKLAFPRHDEMEKYFCGFGIGWVAVITTFIEMTEFYTTSYSFRRYEENYCNETFYWFVYYKNIAFGVLVSLAAMIYIPSFDYGYYFIYI